eukprot:4756632-Karenia_brevis.AAC.1
MTGAFKEAMKTTVDEFRGMQRTAARDEEDDHDKGGGSDKFQAISGLDFKRNLPKIEDTDPDLDRYDLAFDSAIACHSFGSKKIRDIDKLHVYGQGFKEGSTRRRVFENYIRRANREERLPAQAVAVLVEVRAELRTYIWETGMQKAIRLDREFNTLAQGRMSHADFRALFDARLQDMEDCPDYDMPTGAELFRKYLTKLNPDLRAGVQAKDWRVDGEDKPPRAPKTYLELARAVGMLLEEKADIYATGHTGMDMMFNIDGSTKRIINPGPKKGKKGEGGHA